MVKLPVFLAIGGMFALAGCSFAPTYSVPTTITAKTYKEVGSWMQAKPADQIPRSGWWKVYHDPRAEFARAQSRRRKPEPSGSIGASRRGVGSSAAGSFGSIPHSGSRDGR